MANWELFLTDTSNQNTLVDAGDNAHVLSNRGMDSFCDHSAYRDKVHPLDVKSFTVLKVLRDNERNNHKASGQSMPVVPVGNDVHRRYEQCLR